MQGLADVVGTALIDRLPAIVRPAEDTGCQIGAIRDRGKARGKEIGDVRCTRFAESVKAGCLHGTLGIVEQVVIPERIGDKDDDVLFHVAPFTSQ